VALWFAVVATRNCLISAKIPLCLTVPYGQHESFVFPCRARIGFLCGLPEMANGLLSFYHRSKNLTLICHRKLSITGKLLLAGPGRTPAVQGPGRNAQSPTDVARA
jgi:hypothetical protein